MTKTKLWAMLAAMILFGSMTAFAQTVHQVNAGDETLKAAVEAAADGDIIELVDSGGLYTTSSTDKIIINKMLTIRAKEGLEKKPVLRMIKADATSARFFEVRSGGSLVLKGLEFDGRLEEGGANHVKTMVRLDTDDSTEVDLYVEDCLMRYSKEQAIKGFYKTVIDTIVVKNTVIGEITKEGILLYESGGNGPAVHYAEFENLTMYNIGREAIKSEGNDPVMRINHGTFDNAGGSSKRVVYPKGANDVRIKNSLFTNNSYSSFVKLYGNSVFTNNAFFNVAGISTDGENVTVSDTLRVDPQYTDPDNADFTLMDTSPVLGLADDGFALGDLRWDPNAAGPVVHKVMAGDNTLLDAVNAAADGDILELVDGGALYTTSSTDKIYIDKNLTIRAQEGLMQKPILRMTKADASSARFFEVRSGGRLTLKGLEFDGRLEEGGANHVKTMVRLRTGDSTEVDLFVNDVLMRYSKEQAIKGFWKTTIDTISVTNSIIGDIKKEGILLYESSGNGPAVNFANFENLTMYNIGREAIKSEGNNPVMRINHSTFDNAGGSSKRMVYPKGADDVIVKNSIFTNNSYDNFIKLYGNSSFTFNGFFNVAGISTDGENVTVSDTLRADPMYADPTNMDYRLALDSPMRGAADDGRAMGDLRWELDPGLLSLLVLTEGEGSVTLDPPGGIYQPGTVVTVTATPDAGWGFQGWEGVAVFPPNNPVANVTMNESKTIKAIFFNLFPKYTLTVDTLGLGHVDIEPELVEGKLDSGTVFTLTAVAQENWHFVEWLGDLSGSENPISAPLDSNMNVTASFASDFTQFSLTVNLVGEGDVMVSPQPVIATYDTGTVVTLMAEPVLGWQFAGWSGDLTGANNPDSLVMDSDKTITATFEEMSFERRAMEIDTTWDLRDAVEFANNNSTIDSLILITSGGVYTSTSTSDVAVKAPLTVVAAPGLEKKPIITNSDVEKSNDDIFRVFDDFTLDGVVIDGGHERTHGPKYGVRLRHYSNDSVKVGANITIKNTDFVNIFEDKNLSKDGHAFKIDVGVRAGVVKFENCTFNSTGYEAIRISDTEKWATDRALDSLIIRNATFTNIDAEGIRYYSDADPSTPDAPVIIEHVTFNNSATRTMYLKNSGGAIVRDIIIANSRTSGHGRDDDLMDGQGNIGVPSFVSHIDTFNVKAVPIKSTDGQVDEATIWGIDPKFEDPENLNYTLLPESHLYGLGHDGEALGDLNWATNAPTHVALAILIEGEGQVVTNPLPVGKTYDPNQMVTVTAIPDSGWEFVAWSGDVSSTEISVTIKMDASKSITATFQPIETGVKDLAELPTEYSLDQNYPNPFNPTTTIKFALKEGGFTTIKVFDVLGRQVMTLVEKEMAAGRYEIQFNGLSVSSGTYFYRIESGSFSAAKKMILMK